MQSTTRPFGDCGEYHLVSQLRKNDVDIVRVGSMSDWYEAVECQSRVWWTHYELVVKRFICFPESSFFHLFLLVVLVFQCMFAHICGPRCQSTDGLMIAAGLADHSVAVMNFGSRGGSVNEIARLRGGHTHGVSKVHFAGFDKRGKTLVSGGNDRRVCLWDLSNLADNAFSHGSGGGGSRRRDNRGEDDDGDDDDDGAGVVDSGHSSLAPEATIFNSRKINWLDSLEDQLYVADTSHQVKVYSLR